MAIMRVSEKRYINTDQILDVYVHAENDVEVNLTHGRTLRFLSDDALNFRNWLNDTALDYRPPEDAQ